MAAVLPQEVFLSHSSLDSQVKNELTYAFGHNRYDDKIIPIAYQPADFERLSWMLANIQRVDFAGNFDDGCRTLLRIWGLGYQRPPV
jgi:hypothetical protein